MTVNFFLALPSFVLLILYEYGNIFYRSLSRNEERKAVQRDHFRSGNRAQA